MKSLTLASISKLLCAPGVALVFPDTSLPLAAQGTPLWGSSLAIRAEMYTNQTKVNTIALITGSIRFIIQERAKEKIVVQSPAELSSVPN
jgi:hypothetical protein